MNIDVNFYDNKEKVTNCGIIFFVMAAICSIFGLYAPFLLIDAVVWCLCGYFVYHKLSKNALLFGLIWYLIGWLTAIEEGVYFSGLIVRAFITYFLVTGYIAARKVAKDLEKNKATVNV